LGVVGVRPLLVSAAVVVVTLSAGCATFPEQPPQQSWQSTAALTPEAGPTPGLPEDPAPPSGAQAPQGGGGATRPPDGCTDYNSAVIGTCMDTIFAVAVLPGDPQNPSALVGERRTGRILKVQRNSKPVVVAKLSVNTAGDGGLTGLALSPSYSEDQLIFAYITTSTDNRLVRVAPGDKPKPVITGIPRGSTGNRGALAADHGGGLLLATGDAGNASAATNKSSLAGKVLRVDATGKAAEGNPQGDRIIASGLHAPGGACASADGSTAWVTDRTARQDVLYRITPGKALTTPAWTWPDRPGVAGCIAWNGAVSVLTSKEGTLQNLPLAPDGSFTGKPNVTMAGKDGFGLLGGADLLGSTAAVAGTVNKEGGEPVSSDDRAVVLTQQGNAGGGAD
jgi:glucose/arabinose dehydrogenase